MLDAGQPSLFQLSKEDAGPGVGGAGGLPGSKGFPSSGKKPYIFMVVVSV
jgi:hypothetical protein